MIGFDNDFARAYWQDRYRVELEQGLSERLSLTVRVRCVVQKLPADAPSAGGGPDAPRGARNIPASRTDLGDRVMKNMGDLQKMAREMQANMAKAQEELAAATVEGTAGGGAVVVVLTGTQDVKSVKIQKDAVDPEDVETLQDLVLAAFTDALKKSRELAAQRLGSVTGGLKIPGM